MNTSYRLQAKEKPPPRGKPKESLLLIQSDQCENSKTQIQPPRNQVKTAKSEKYHQSQSSINSIAYAIGSSSILPSRNSHI